jgi:hypothetical protein
MFKVRCKDFGNYMYELRNHVGRCSSKKVRKGDDEELPQNCLIGQARENKPILLF